MPSAELISSAGGYTLLHITHPSHTDPTITFLTTRIFDQMRVVTSVTSLLHAPCELPLATMSFRQLQRLFGTESLPQSGLASPPLPVFHSRLKIKLFTHDQLCIGYYITLLFTVTCLCSLGTVCHVKGISFSISNSNNSLSDETRTSSIANRSNIREFSHCFFWSEFLPCVK